MPLPTAVRGRHRCDHRPALVADLAAMEPQEIRRVIATRLEAPEPVALNQQLWARVVDDVFAAVDGGPTSPAIEPLAVGIRASLPSWTSPLPGAAAGL